MPVADDVLRKRAEDLGHLRRVAKLIESAVKDDLSVKIE
jgi:hypothetical protein